MDEAAPDWQQIARSVLAMFRDNLEPLGIPVIHGDFMGDGHTLIKTPTWAEDFKRLGMKEQSIAVLEIDHVLDDIDSDKADDEKQLTSVAVYVRLGASNTWLYDSFFVPDEQDEDGDNDGFALPLYEKETPEQAAVMHKYVLALAMDKTFASFRNQNQRTDYALSVLEKSGESLPRHLVGDVSYRAFVFYDFGILPTRAKALLAEGKTASEIAKTLGITKARVEKSLDREVIDIHLEYLKEIGL